MEISISLLSAQEHPGYHESGDHKEEINAYEPAW